MGACTEHFAVRVRERIGEHVNPYALARDLVAAVRDGSDLVEFVARVNANGLRVFRFRAGERVFFALIDTNRWQAVTVLLPGHCGRIGKAKLELRDCA